MAHHVEQDPLVDFDDQRTTLKETEDCAVAGGDGSLTRHRDGECFGDENAKWRVNDECDETARTIADINIPVGDCVDIFRSALVTCAYTTSEQTAATKHGRIDSLRWNKDSVVTNRPIANAGGPHFVDSLLHSFITQPYVLSGRTGVRATTVQNGVLERSGPRSADNINTNAEVMLASEDGINRMVITRSQSADLRRQQQLQ